MLCALPLCAPAGLSQADHAYMLSSSAKAALLLLAATYDPGSRPRRGPDPMEALLVAADLESAVAAVLTAVQERDGDILEAGAPSSFEQMSAVAGFEGAAKAWSDAVPMPLCEC